ncbi:MAG: ACGX-repeat peptide [Desulfovibrio sp.]|nr:ACGX-repeat peptide [Desulfovibrio sp.]
MALSNLSDWNGKGQGMVSTACGSKGKPAACGSKGRPAACGSKGRPAACGSKGRLVK